ncbi:TIGR02450 family Trp-rich protein [Shewanella livingstonensis]|uniref:TIGR02450 family Trp-rich protein n=1 Tax=Shewanella livingstonensis TaxID=150120 RepID=A0A3G8M0J6_9GAMM|nr:TIGR02450 family Trp-rich protein [Shewanella livingstonensis]AZG74570.1 TIGR02450 family Trp-rich protein [Shewanella livingstonensis]
MSPIHPKKLLNSKWTKVNVVHKLKHFSVIKAEYDEQQNVIECIIRAEINAQEFAIDWRDLKNSQLWKVGWQ